MKSLIVYVDPSKGFCSKEHEELAKMQIDNDLDVGWKVEDIIFAGNFDFEYKGVKTTYVEDDCYYVKSPRASKVPIINRLFEKGIIKEGEIWWFHDQDAFQLERLKEPDMGGMSFAFTSHGWDKKWNAGSFFFTLGAKDIFRQMEDCMYEQNLDEQDACLYMITHNVMPPYKLLNLTYNFGIYKHPFTLPRTEKPILVAHFHPRKPKHMDRYRHLIPERFANLLKTYGIS